MKDKIFVTFTGTDELPLGTIWMIQAAKTDFYLKPVGGLPLFHLSAHGPNSVFAGHRFHVKVDDGAVDSRVRKGQFVAHSVPADGQVIRGTQLATDAYLVVRVRWTSDLQQPSYRTAALRRGDLPSKEYDGRAGRKLSWSLNQDQAVARKAGPGRRWRSFPAGRGSGRTSKPGRGEDLQVVTDRRLGERERFGQVADAGFPVLGGLDQGEQLQPGRVSQGLQQAGEVRSF